jgi:hypothetical protein
MALSRTWSARSTNAPARRFKTKHTKVKLTEQSILKELDKEILKYKKGWQNSEDYETE